VYDFHLHSHFSNDSTASMQSMAEKARSIGLKGICFTDHYDLEYQSTEINFEFSYDEYLDELNNLKASLPEGLEIYSGIELGMQPHLSTKNEALLKGKNFDIIIGSIHCVGKKDIYDRSFLEGITEDEGIINYFGDMLKCIDNFKNFDILGHMDGIRRYLYNKDESFSLDVYEELIQSVLSKLVHSNKGIEVNTAGLRYGLSTFHPLPDILKLYRTLGGEIVTVGSDSHSPEYLGYGIKNALATLSDLGFKYYTIYKDRKPIFIKI
jgi:histidinol-phosphatase (PHP family)